jgi:protein-S-isoprenylcysteine O-methyltransferase Ste14
MRTLVSLIVCAIAVLCVVCGFLFATYTPPGIGSPEVWFVSGGVLLVITYFMGAAHWHEHYDRRAAKREARDKRRKEERENEERWCLVEEKIDEPS